MGTFKQEAFYGWHKDEAVRRKSSSGGVFSALAEKTLNKKGIVFGAVHDLHQKKVRHASTEEYGLSAFRKSKYVQSYIGTSFRKAEGFLKEGKEIFFTGTPCQIAGFKTYLGKDYPNLLTCDFICHGVPSMKLLNDHLDLLENKFRADIVEVDFRPKTYGWSTHLLKCVFSDGAEYIKHHQFDAYIAAFYLNLSLRRSCYQCRYSDTQHRADLTVADYWGYRRFSPDINDEKGLSLIMANTGKGESAINESQNMVYRTVDWKYADYVFCRHDKENFYKERRDEFFNYYLDNGWKKTVLQYRLRGKWYLRVKRNIVHNILRKLNLV
jgi:coenzyme F420-reducing hydrogenase beta subunit